MEKRKQILLLIVAILGTCTLQAQDEKDDRYNIPIGTFKLSLVAGLNAAQIDGDALAGYNKVGLMGGLRVGYRIKKSWMPSFGILYTQKGSRSQTRLDLFDTNYKLDYVEIPVMMNFMDKGVRISGGLAYGRLLNINIIQQDFDETDLRAPYYRNNDISTVLGFGYFINDNWGFDLRWTRSIFSIVDIEVGNVINERQINKFLSFRALYQF